MTRHALLRQWGEFEETRPLILAPICTDIPLKVGIDLGGDAVARAIHNMRMAIAVNALGLPAVAYRLASRMACLRSSRSSALATAKTSCSTPPPLSRTLSGSSARSTRASGDPAWDRDHGKRRTPTCGGIPSCKTGQPCPHLRRLVGARITHSGAAQSDDPYSTSCRTGIVPHLVGRDVPRAVAFRGNGQVGEPRRCSRPWQVTGCRRRAGKRGPGRVMTTCRKTPVASDV